MLLQNQKLRLSRPLNMHGFCFVLCLFNHIWNLNLYKIICLYYLHWSTTVLLALTCGLTWIYTTALFTVRHETHSHSQVIKYWLFVTPLCTSYRHTRYPFASVWAFLQESLSSTWLMLNQSRKPSRIECETHTSDINLRLSRHPCLFSRPTFVFVSTKVGIFFV